MNMKAINLNSVYIQRAILLHMSGQNSQGTPIKITWLCYVPTNYYLSRDACTGLGFISKDFPQIGEAAAPLNKPHQNTPTMECHCLKQTSPPSLLMGLSFPATEKHCNDLRKWLIDHYNSSTFNTGKPQTLLLMEGPPLKLNINPNATPVAVNTLFQYPSIGKMR